MAKSVYVDMNVRATPQEAVTLMFHHLALAVAFFEITPVRGKPFANELKRLSDIDRGAAEAWLKALEEGYENTGVL